MKIFEFIVKNTTTLRTGQKEVSHLNSEWDFIIRLSNLYPLLSILLSFSMLQPFRESLDRLFNNLIREIKNNTSFQAIKKKIFRPKSSTQMVKITNESLEEIAGKGVPSEEMNIILDKVIRANEFSESFKYLCTCKSENNILTRRPIREMLK